MLSLGRNPGQYIVINGNIIVQVVSVDGMLRLAIDAPKDILIERGENYERQNEVPDCIRHSRQLAMKRITGVAGEAKKVNR